MRYIGSGHYGIFDDRISHEGSAYELEGVYDTQENAKEKGKALYRRSRIEDYTVVRKVKSDALTSITLWGLYVH